MLSVSASSLTRGLIFRQRKMKNKMGLKLMMTRVADHRFCLLEKAAGSLDKELAASGFTRKEQAEMEKVYKLQHETTTSCSGENKLRNPPTDSNGHTEESLESGGNDDNDDDSSGDPDYEDDAVLTRLLNKLTKRAIAAAHGQRRPLS